MSRAYYSHTLVNHTREFKMIIKNKRIVITGGTSGIGYELTKQFHIDNEIIVISRSNSKLRRLSNKHNNVTCYQADLSKLEEVESIAGILVKKYDSIDILINNAAVQFTPSFLDGNFSYESIANEITLNLTSICCLIYLFLPLLDQSKKSIILNVNSGLALAPKTTSAIYCATKGGLNIFTQSLRYQLENTNISVQQVFLELVDTAMTVGRGENKMSAQQAAQIIIDGMERNILDQCMGKVKLLRLLLRLAPSLAKKIMKKY